ncbi:family 78 glycoside hydrolase catalytic domain [Lactobacillus delbrueckii subsp. bulgaricus]
MKITDIQINHMTRPVGFDLSDLQIDFATEGQWNSETQKSLKIWTDSPGQPAFQQTADYTDNVFRPEIRLQPRTRYFVEIGVSNTDESAKGTSWFETGKMNEPYLGSWLGNADKNIENTLFRKKFILSAGVKNARLYATGLGVYEARLNGQKIGTEYLAPGLTAYDQWVQVQTYDVTNLLQGGQNELLFSVGDGWYKGNFLYSGGRENIYGDQQRILAELHLELVDGTEEVIVTDSSWETAAGPVTKSGIYYGEDFDGTFVIDNWQEAEILNAPKDVLTDRYSLPLTIQDELPVKEVLLTPKGEKILDFGQNHAGTLSFYNHLPKGHEVIFSFGEILQDGNFYRDNLRCARAQWHVKSDGEEKWIKPAFTYFGFRYVKVEGLEVVNPEDFKAPVIYSQMERTGSFKSDNTKVNRLFQNIMWGQRSNFFDVPTDCPQRDERLGWTGDAEIFSDTAAYNMSTYQFFKKYSRDMLLEQQTHEGMLTMYAPSMKDDDGGNAIWGDAATIIPWNMYLHYGDSAILKQNYQAMKAWVDWIGRHTKKAGMWINDFQLGDWLAMDGQDKATPAGATDNDYLASIYYLNSARIVAKSASILGYEADKQKYDALAAVIKKNIQDEFVTKAGRIASDTQTARVMALQFDVVDKEQEPQVISDLVKRIHQDRDHITTGFAGLAFLNRTLSRFGEHELAVTIFLNEDKPSWLYAVNLGATTIWERWNSVLADGHMNPAGMNSLNHYSFGSIASWMYEYLLGFRDYTPGMQKIKLAPLFTAKLQHLQGSLRTSYGLLKVEYQLETNSDHLIEIELSVPFGMQVTVDLPRSENVVIYVNSMSYSEKIVLTGGEYHISYVPTKMYIETYSMASTPIEILNNSKLKEQFIALLPEVYKSFDHQGNVYHMMGNKPLTEVLARQKVSKDRLEKFKRILETIRK